MLKSGNKYIFLTLFCFIMIGSIIRIVWGYYYNYSVILGSSTDLKEIFSFEQILTLGLCVLFFLTEHYKLFKFNVSLYLLSCILVVLKIVITWGTEGGIISPLIDNVLLIGLLAVLVQYPKILKENENLTKKCS
jgi:hypothetical protein